MKNFKEYLAETGAMGIANQTYVSVDGSDTYDITNPEVLARVNAFVGSIADREYLIPENAVGQLRNFLLRIGLQFPKVELPEGSGKVTVPLSQWGGRFGKDGEVDFDEFVNDDGISNRKEGGLNLQIESEPVGRTGSFKVYAKIV
jgi:hypothetical protein